IVALLRSPHFVFVDAENGVTRDAVSALDRALSEARYLGDPEALAALAADWRDDRSAPAFGAALAIAEELAPLMASRPASEQLRTLHVFWSAHLRPLDDAAPVASRERGDGAVL